MSLDASDRLALLRTFLADADERLRRVEAGLVDDVQPADELVLDAHTLMGSASVVGLTSFAAESRRLEAALAAGNVGGARALVVSLSAELAAQCGRRTVLAIDDDPTSRLLLERVAARDSRIALTLAPDGESGLRLARELQPDIVLLDVRLPDMTGGEVLRRLRGDPVTEAVSVVVMSADAASGHAQALLAAGATAYITKPYDVEELLELMGGRG